MPNTESTFDIWNIESLNLDQIFDDFLEKYERLPTFFHFDKRKLFSFETLLERIRGLNPDREFTEAEIEYYISNGFLPELKLDYGQLGFPEYSIQRINFINDIKQKWGYDHNKLKQIVDYEEWLIDEIYTVDNFRYDFKNHLEIYLQELKDEIIIDKLLLKITKSSEDHIPDLKSYMDDNKIKLRILEIEESEDLSIDKKNQITKKVFAILARKEFLRLIGIETYRAQIKLGFSHNIRFRESFDKKISPKKISPKYKYTYKDDKRVWYFGDWTYSDNILANDTDFFATPEFLIEFNGKEKIKLHIRDPINVTTKYLRSDICKIYTKFRSALKPQKKKWGELSGARDSQKKRDESLRYHYRLLMQMKRGVASDRILDEVLEKIAKEFGRISPERARKIIYSKKK